MIIKNDQKRKISLWPFTLLAIGIILFLGFRQFLSGNSSSKNNGVIQCSMENLEGDYFKTGPNLFSNVHTRTKEKARTGNYASLVDEKNAYGVKYELKDFNIEDQICASIWRWSSISNHGVLAAQGNEGSDFFIQNNDVFESSEDGWEKLQLCFTVPKDYELKVIKIFPYSLNEKGKIYFDDLEINIKTAKSQKALLKDGQLQAIDLYIDQKGMRKLAQKRNEALRLGILANNEKYVDAKLSENGESQNIALRLKGDWTDHLQANRWSFRIKTDKSKAWNRMQSFSFQSPERRFYASEWLFHKMLEAEDVLTTRYDFIQLKLNDQVPMIYAYEEHFDKQLPEYKNRREGVILKFSEDAVWEQRMRAKKETGTHETILLNDKFNADILPFKESRISKDSNLMKQFNTGRSLLYDYKNQQQSAEAIFDIDRMAKYYAIMEILNAYHSLVWHNQRFYYNPVTQLLEPIGYDGYVDEGEYDITHHLCFGFYKSNVHMDDWSRYYAYLFRNEVFTEMYVKYLTEFSSKEYLDSFFENISNELEARVTLLQSEFPDYKLDIKRIFDKSKKIHSSIKAFDNISIKAFTQSVDNGEKIITLSNYHLLPIEIIASGKSQNYKTAKPLEKKHSIWSNHPSRLPEYKEIRIASNDQFVFFRVIGDEKIYFSQIKSWPHSDKAFDPSKNWQTSIPLASNDYIESNNRIQILPGKYQVNMPMVISDKILEIAPGTTLDFGNSAYLKTNRRVQMIGTSEQPIVLGSTDKTGQGILVLKAQEKSQLKNVHFNNLDNIDIENYTTTGAVSFYESNVDLIDCKFANNSCEDALNIIRSNFKIERMHMSRTYADGFDADFCTGIIKDSYITLTGNDGLDFSGSNITIDNCILKDVGDKAISAGEEANLSILSCSIDGGDIGVASKDLSKVVIENIEISNCNKAFAAYQKKPEYGPGYIDIKNYKVSSNQFLELKEEGSIIKFPSSEQ